jgi:hypothetical protein
MMLRNLIDEVRNRRVLAFAALGVLVALALPLMFLKSAPDGAPASDAAAPAAAKEAKLPPRAARLLQTTDPGAPGGRAKGSAQDPFAPPASYRAAAAAAASKGAAGAADSSGAKSAANSPGAASATPTKPIPVVIQDGSPAKKKQASSRSRSNPSTSSPTRSTRTLTVDIRYGKKKDSPIKRAIPRNQAFYIHGKLVAMYVRYSESRKKAIFAVAPGVHISGPVSSRVSDNVRYIDVPAGEHAWLTIVTANRTIVKRRLDVVRARSVSGAKTTNAAASAESACLLGKLTAMKPGDRFLDRDACEL